MSQKKVDLYKEQKANRSQIMKKEKRMLMIEKIIGAVVGVLVVCWVVFSIVNKLTAKDDTATEVVETAMDTSAIDDFVSALSAEDEEELTEAGSEELTEADEEDGEAEEEAAEETDEEEAEEADKEETAETEEETAETEEETAEADEEAAGTEEEASAEETAEEAEEAGEDGAQE